MYLSQQIMLLLGWKERRKRNGKDHLKLIKNQAYGERRELDQLRLIREDLVIAGLFQQWLQSLNGQKESRRYLVVKQNIQVTDSL